MQTIERDAYRVIGITGWKVDWRYVTGVQTMRGWLDPGAMHRRVIAGAVCVDREGAVGR